MAMLPNGTIVGDGSWVLRIHVTDINVDREFRVKGDMHVGGVMLRLVEDLDLTRDWSDHALWWPQRNKWLSHTRSTLDQYGVTSESLLEFTPMHKYARVQLPDLQYITARLDFSVPVFSAVIQLCKDIGCRHPEEISLKRYIDPDSLAKQTPVPSERRDLGYTLQTQYQLNQQQLQTLKREKDTGHSQSAHNLSSYPSVSPGGGGHSPVGGAAFGTHPQPYPPPAVAVSPGSTLSLNRAGSVPPTPSHAVNNTPIISPYSPTNYGTLSSQVDGTGGTLPRSATVTPAVRILTSPSWEASLVAENYDEKLVHSPRQVPVGALATAQFRPKNFIEKAALNRGWLDSSRSLMEQGILENDIVLLRFKFMLFFDLNPKYDPVRINQIFEQAKWSLLLEEIDCTEEESFMFAALQLQTQLRTELKQSGEQEPDVDDVDVMLNELESVLQGTVISKHGGDITLVPELADYLRFLKPKKLALKNWRRAYFTFKDLYVSWYNNANESYQQPIGRVYLKGCEVTQEVNLSEAKYLIKLLLPSAEGMSEMWLRCDSEQQYAKWLAACKLGSKGKTMADAGYQAEVDSIRRVVSMQHSPSEVPATRIVQAPQNLNPDDYLPVRYAKKGRSNQYLVQRILEAHKNVNELSLADAKLQYIRAWQALPEQCLHYFVVRFRNGRKAELVAIAFNRLMRMNLDSGESIKTWRFSDIKRWHVNWEIKRIFIQHEEEDIEFSCLSADCKVPHEFIGGYIYLGMRSKDQNQILNAEQFHKLTGGWT